MAKRPDVDRRRRADIRNHVESVAPYYTDDWDPSSEDVGSALVALFAEMAADVTERLDRTPEKHRIAFFDSLGFDRRPPLAATLPVTFTIADGADGNVAIESGTEVVAGATDDRSEATFRLGRDGEFEATPAHLREIYSVEPDSDQLFAHQEVIDGGPETTLFAGKDRQQNVLYVGHPDLLDVSDQSKITVYLETSAAADIVRNGLVWEYYGERTVDGEAVEGWHELMGPATWADHWPPDDLIEPIKPTIDPIGSFAERERSVTLEKRLFKGTTASIPTAADARSTAKRADLADVFERAGVGELGELREKLSGITMPFPEVEFPQPSPDGDSGEESTIAVDLAPAGPFVDTEINGVESKWLRCRVPDARTPTGPYDMEFDAVSLDVGPIPSGTDVAGEDGAAPSFAPDLLLANDVPQKMGDGESITPFGEMPQQRDAFYVASQEALSKKGATVTLTFGESSDADEASDGSLDIQEAIAEIADIAEDVAIEEIAEIAEVAERAGVEKLPKVAEFVDDAKVEEVVKIAEIGEKADIGTIANMAAGTKIGEVAKIADRTDFSGLEPDLFGDIDDAVADFVPFGSDSDDGNGDTDPPRLSWEYWNGDGWLPLDNLVDETNRLQKPGPVRFTVPEDVAATSVGGHEGVWIRVRLVAGDYGEVVYEHVESEEGEHWEQKMTGPLPKYDTVEVGYEYPDGRDPAHLFAYNNREFGPDLLDRTAFRPFEVLADDDQAVYFGFDGPLRDGPIQLLVDLADHEYPEGFNPRVRWEYCTDPEHDVWLPINGSDASEGFTEQGITSLAFPEETAAFSRFGHERHWIRARVRGNAFGTPLSANGAPEDATIDRQDVQQALDRLAADDRAGVRRLADLDAADLQELRDALSTERQIDDDACGEVVETEPPAGKPTNERPTLRGVYPNTGMATNVTVVEDEVVGSSDGSRGQSFVVSRPPVVAGDVWVDELTAISASEREELVAERPDAVDERTGSDGETSAFWVRWERVEEFFESDADDRHYVLDPVAGEITFGDGTAGRIPPHGRDNVQVTYRTGGGPQGNVAPGAVGELKSAIPLVDAVTNPSAGAGGARSESTEAVLERAPRTLRDRGRAVTAADFERIALDASRQLARVRCLPEMDRSGERAPGWVTLLVVPNDQRRKPAPSVGLKRQVRRAVSERAPARLVAQDHIEVRGPSYVAVQAEATVVAGDVGSLGTLEASIDDRLTAFFHPLTGGEEGDGWAFGDLPTLSDVFALLEGIDGVDHVSDLRLHFEGSGDGVTIMEGEPKPSVTPDALVHSGVHDLTVEFANRTRRREEI